MLGSSRENIKEWRKKNTTSFVLTFCLSVVMKDLLWDFFKTPLELWGKVEQIQRLQTVSICPSVCLFVCFCACLFTFTCLSHWLVQTQTHILNRVSHLNPGSTWTGEAASHKKVEREEERRRRRQRGYKRQENYKDNGDRINIFNTGERGRIAIKATSSKKRELQIQMCNTQ